MKKKWIGVALCAWSTALQADTAFVEQEGKNSPWLTGPLLAPTQTATPKGTGFLQGYAALGVSTGIYDHHWKPRSTPNYYSANLQAYGSVGLTEWMDFQITVQGYENWTEGKASTQFGDIYAGFDFQLFPVHADKWYPGVKLGIVETLPTGKYQRLNPRKKFTDFGGMGSFETMIDLVFYQLYHLKKKHYLSASAAVTYTLSAPVDVHGFNFYGGGDGFRSRVFPGAVFEAIASFEYTFNQHWVFAIDNVYSHRNRTRYTHVSGPDAAAGISDFYAGSGENFSFAPAIEYNFSSRLGLIAGVWFSALGRNAYIFRNGIFSVYYGF